MPVDCPHCAKPIENFIPKDRLDVALAAKKAAEDAIAPLKVKAEAYDSSAESIRAAQADAAKARGELATFQVGVKKGVTDPRALASLVAIHAAEMAGTEEAKRTDLGTWLDGDGAQHPVVGLVIKAGTNTAPAPGATTTPAPGSTTANPNPLPNPNAGTTTTPAPGAQTKLTPEQVRAHFQSPAFRSLPREEQKKQRTTMEAQYADATPTPGT